MWGRSPQQGTARVVLYVTQEPCRPLLPPSATQLLPPSKAPHPEGTPPCGTPCGTHRSDHCRLQQHTNDHTRAEEHNRYPADPTQSAPCRTPCGTLCATIADCSIIPDDHNCVEDLCAAVPALCYRADSCFMSNAIPRNSTTEPPMIPEPCWLSPSSIISEARACSFLLPHVISA
jgi:hypothetical protein